ncbi:MAG: sensor histidine kinase N-terminal domain-containing protein [Deltaproteobacteria bacterium]|jgi:two-component system sensor histidine kinase QseC|nr:sensor histidine kinase N-terminal domain-containing protein [Deltaproteobacteria bacterium]
MPESVRRVIDRLQKKFGTLERFIFESLCESSRDKFLWPEIRRRILSAVKRFFAASIALALKAAETALRLILWGLSRLWERFQGLPLSKKSLRLRLSLFFTAFLAFAWFGAAFFAWMECEGYINEFFDTQQMLFAKRLAETDFTNEAAVFLKTRERLPGVDKKAAGDLEDDALGFAVFTIAGELVMADGKNGRRFTFEPDKKGFSDMRLPGEKGVWRVVRLVSRDGRHIITVGQEEDYRQDMMLDMLSKQIMPWLVLLPVLLSGLIFILSRELAPLRALAKRLRTRPPEDAVPLDLSQIPSEALPLAEALNGFFSRTKAMLTRERSFISDAAHELRTPLAGLRVQAQVAAQRGIRRETRQEALGFLLQGIDRCARLVEQLLELSRLEAMGDIPPVQDAPFAGLCRSTLEWPVLLDEIVREYGAKAERKGLALKCELAPAPSPIQGYPALISMLLRNLLDNAVIYAPRNGYIRIYLENSRLNIENNAPEFSEAHASRLGERFFRPPGQEEPGSGLGLSIVRRIAEIHHFGLSVRARRENQDGAETVFCVTLTFNNAVI